ncbi:MAG: CBS domain-containing protein, partial [Acholeplasmataceae bacterium]
MMKDNYLKLTKKEKKFFLKNLHGYDTAELFNNLELEDQEELFSLLTFKNKAILISYLSPYQASVLLESLPKNQAINIINYLEPDDLTDILKELDEAVLKEWVTDLDETTKEEFQSLKDYEEDEAGSRMSPNLIKLSPEMEIKEAMQLLIKEAPHVETIQTLFVVDKFNSFLGIVPLKK